MALQIYETTGMASYVLLTDSMYVVQVLEDSIVAARHAGLTSELLAVWNRLLLVTYLEVRWVKGHADRHAREMLGAAHCRVEYCRALTGERI